MSESIGFINLLQAIFMGRMGNVASGATTTSVPTAGNTYVPSAWKGGYMYFVNGAAQGQFAAISDNTASTFTVTNLSTAPAQGDSFILYLGSEVNVSVTAPENIAQWNTVSVASPLDDNSDGVAAVSGGLPRFLARLTAWTGSAWSRLKLAASGGLSVDIAGINGTTQTGADWTPLLQGAAVKQGTLIDRSGTITTANTSQQLAPANPNRRYLLIQNNSSSPLWFNFTAAATTSQPSIQLAAGQGFVMENGFISTEAVNIIGGTAGQAFTAKEG